MDLQRTAPNPALRRTAIALRVIAAGKIGRYSAGLNRFLLQLGFIQTFNPHSVQELFPNPERAVKSAAGNHDKPCVGPDTPIEFMRNLFTQGEELSYLFYLSFQTLIGHQR